MFQAREKASKKSKRVVLRWRGPLFGSCGRPSGWCCACGERETGEPLPLDYFYTPAGWIYLRKGKGVEGLGSIKTHPYILERMPIFAAVWKTVLNIVFLNGATINQKNLSNINVFILPCMCSATCLNKCVGICVCLHANTDLWGWVGSIWPAGMCIRQCGAPPFGSSAEVPWVSRSSSLHHSGCTLLPPSSRSDSAYSPPQFHTENQKKKWLQLSSAQFAKNIILRACKASPWFSQCPSEHIRARKRIKPLGSLQWLKIGEILKL